jgi:hypothetical protein
MANWTVTEVGLNYEMEYPNGFKRSIRKSQIAKNEKGALLEYASSQNPYRVLASNTYSITSYTAGVSTIGLTNNGGDDWDIGFKITPDTVQSTANIVGYQYSVNFWNSGVDTALSDGFKTTDFTFNTAGNGSGVYELSQLYIFDDSSTFYTYSLFKVNASGTVIAYVKMQGITVNSTSGIDINATANVSQYGVSYPLQWISFDTYPPTVFNPIGNTTTINVALPIDAIGVGCIAVLDSVFTNDITDSYGMAISLIIS